RVRYMAENAGIAVTVSERRLSEQAPDGEKVWLEEMVGEGEGWRRPGIWGRQLAYVLYTSGATGQPKGAMIEHRGMNNHVRAKVEELGVERGEGGGQNAAAAVDIAIWQILAPLVSGGRVEVMGEEEAGDSEGLLESVERRQVGVLETVPAMLAMMVEQQRVRSRKLASLRWLICNAEALPVGLCRG